MVQVSQITCTFFAIIFLITVGEQLIHARPSDGVPQNSLEDRLKRCDLDDKIEETCQRCAKITKSTVVYPMCCSNEEDVYVWCQKYMGYGIH